MALMADILEEAKESTSTTEALGHPQWRAAMQVEYDSIIKKKTWELINLPSKKKVVGTKRIWKVKYKADDTLEKYRARLIAQGFLQVEGSDAHETFAPAARMTMIRTVLAVVAQKKWPTFQMDVKFAFLTGDLKKEVHVAQPLDFENGECHVALDFFLPMLRQKIVLGSFTYVSVLNACSCLAALELKMRSNVYIRSFFVNMYAKSGRLDIAHKVFYGHQV
ncbi:hypothetical protein L7F22_001527 [Adiantum nelumboides]|nr:hypothetical protein [Adiantum nelumboides]